MVASRSYALYLSAQGQSFTANSALCSGWTSSEVLQSRWGSDYAANMQRLQSLAARTGQAVLLYNGQPAAACYHAISSGHTEASQNVWGGQLPYLCGVDSAWDKFADGYEVTIQYSAEQVRTALEELGLTPNDSRKLGRCFHLGQSRVCAHVGAVRPNGERAGGAQGS